MRCIGIIGAMSDEVAGLKALMQDTQIIRKASMEFYSGILEGKKVVVVQSGIGKVNAAVCTQILIDDFQAEVVINTGIAGSLNNEINIGDIVVSTDLVHHDVDAGAFGYKKGQVRSLAVKVCREVNPDIQVFEGRIASGDQFVADQGVKDVIVSEFGAYAVEMEGAAIAHAAYLNHVPCLVVRAISDKADGSAEVDYPAFEKLAIEHSMKLTRRILREMQA